MEMYSVSMFHQLHCLVSFAAPREFLCRYMVLIFWQASLQSVFKKIKQGDQNLTCEQQQDELVHVMHCFEYIRLVSITRFLEVPVVDGRPGDYVRGRHDT